MLGSSALVTPAFPFNHEDLAVGVTFGVGANASFSTPAWWPLKASNFSGIATQYVSHVSPLSYSYGVTYYIPEQWILNNLINTFNNRNLFTRLMPVKFEEIGFGGRDPYIRVDSLDTPATFVSRSISMSNAIVSSLFMSVSQGSGLAGTITGIANSGPMFSALAVITATSALIGAYKDIENANSGAQNYMSEALNDCGISI